MASTHAPAGEINKSGHCSGTSTWALEVETEGSKIEVDFEVNTAKAGRAWSVSLKDNGTVFWSGSRTTQADGDFEVEKSTTNRSGSDLIVARATNKSTGEVCRGTATI